MPTRRAGRRNGRTCPPAVDLRRIAEWAGVSADEIQTAQPRAAPLDDADSRIELRADRAGRAPPRSCATRLAAASPNELNALQWYIVKRGETLTTIARKLRVNRTDLAEANYLKTGVEGRRRPEAADSAHAVGRAPRARRLRRRRRDVAETMPSTRRPTPADDEETRRVTYRVQAGDTLFAIAKRHGTTVESLKALNNLRSSAAQGRRPAGRADRPRRRTPSNSSSRVACALQSNDCTNERSTRTRYEARWRSAIGTAPAPFGRRRLCFRRRPVACSARSSVHVLRLTAAFLRCSGASRPLRHRARAAS